MPHGPDLKPLFLVSLVMICSCAPSWDVPTYRAPGGGPPISGPEPGEGETARRGVLPESGPLELTVEIAVLAALENNRSLKAERLAPAIARTSEDLELAAFDPLLSAEISKDRKRTEGSVGPASDSTSDLLSGEISLGAYLPTGTAVEIEAGCEALDSSLYSDEANSATLGLTVTQALLKGSGIRPNLASLRQSKLDTFRSRWEFLTR